MWIIQSYSAYTEKWSNTPNIHTSLLEAEKVLYSRISMEYSSRALKRINLAEGVPSDAFKTTGFRIVECKIVLTFTDPL